MLYTGSKVHFAARQTGLKPKYAALNSKLSRQVPQSGKYLLRAADKF